MSNWLRITWFAIVIWRRKKRWRFSITNNASLTRNGFAENIPFIHHYLFNSLYSHFIQKSGVFFSSFVLTSHFYFLSWIKSTMDWKNDQRKKNTENQYNVPHMNTCCYNIQERQKKNNSYTVCKFCIWLSLPVLLVIVDWTWICWRQRERMIFRWFFFSSFAPCRNINVFSFRRFHIISQLIIVLKPLTNQFQFVGWRLLIYFLSIASRSFA